MRGLAIPCGLIVGVLVQALPVAAAHNERARAVTPPAAAKHEPAPVGVCEIDLKRLEAFLAGKAAAPKDAVRKAPAKAADKNERPAVAQNHAAPCATPAPSGDDKAGAPPTSTPLG